ncbi:MAG: MFS transporter [Bacillota bacterium]|nr:MFS transporter [Bacillota bacterium]
MSNKLVESIKITFHSLKYKNFRYFWVGQCISLTGTWMQRTAQVWLVYTVTKSPLLVGILGVCQFMPMLLFSLFAGVIVDRFPKKNLILLTQILFMLQAAIMTILTFTGRIQYWHVFILSAFYGITQTIDMPARQSFFFELVGKDDIMNAISLNSSIVNLAKIVGPAISGAIMVAFGPVVCFFINAVSYIAVIGGILMIKIEPYVPKATHRRMLPEISEGLRYIKKSKTLMLNVIVMGIVCTFAMNNDVVIPVFSRIVLNRGASGYTTLLSAAGVGSFIGAIVMAFISKNGLHKNLLIITGIATGALQILTLLTKQYALCMLLLAFIGFSNLAFINTANSIFQIYSSDEYRGRVMSVYSFLNQGSTPIGNFYAGTVMEHIGGDSGFVSCGVATLLFLFIAIACNIKTVKQWMFPATKSNIKLN